MQNLLQKHFNGDYVAAFAYGSGVFKQRTSHQAEMIDFLLLVKDDDWTGWHERNRARNPQDYPSFAGIGLRFFVPGCIYFVPGVKIDAASGANMKIKYGVVRWSDFMRDLLTWNQLYVAGRLHKPTLLFPRTDVDFLSSAMQQNYSFALNVSMLLTARAFEPDFKATVRRIVGLSYAGDPRPEAPGKVESIVEGQLAELEALYAERFEQLVGELKGLDCVERRSLLLRRTPSTFLQNLFKAKKSRNVAELSFSCSEADCEAAVKRIVKGAAWRQMILGAISCKPAVSASYALSKIKKWLK